MAYIGRLGYNQHEWMNELYNLMIILLALKLTFAWCNVVVGDLGLFTPCVVFGV